MTKLDDLIFHDDEAARTHFEALRWPDGRVCPHCGTIGNSALLQGKSTRAGVYKCRDCKKPFTATVGTIFESSHIPLRTWLAGTHIMCSSKKGVSALQLQRQLGLGSYRSAWFMAHRIREAMKTDDLPPMGGEGGVVEVDETFFGQDPNSAPSKMAIRSMNKIVTLLDRDSGQTRSIVVREINMKTIAELLNAHLSPAANLMTDEANHYKTPGKAFAGHRSVNHAQGEYAKLSDSSITTNRVEGFFAIFKRGMRGIYQHCGSQHLSRYLTEFDFRYSNRQATGCDDTERARRAIKGVIGRRLMYRMPYRRGLATGETALGG